MLLIEIVVTRTNLQSILNSDKMIISYIDNYSEEIFHSVIKL